MPQPRPRRRAAVALVAAAALLTGCVAGNEDGGAGSADDAPRATGIPQPDAEGYAPVSIHLTTPAWSAPPGAVGERLGCGDLLVAARTVPLKDEDPAVAALDFLLQDAAVSHGDPALVNAVAASADTLILTGHRSAGGEDVFEFSGDVVFEGECAAERIRAQLQRTAESATGGQVRLEIDGVPLDDYLGLAPMTEGEQYTAPGEESDEPAEPEQSAAPEQSAEPEAPSPEPTVPPQEADASGVGT